MKKYVTISLFVFWALVVAILVSGFIIRDKKSTNESVNNRTDQIVQVNQITGVDSSVKTLTLSFTEFAKHNSSASCWLLISGKIYDVTKYLNSHPGGEAEILKTCGTDATVIYGNRDNTGSHSSRAQNMLTKYYIGDLKQ